MDKLEEKAIDRIGELLKDDIFECVVVSDAERCYIEGYKDAQKETIEKVCKWIEENIDNYLIYPFCEYDKTALLNILKKDMEEIDNEGLH